MSERFHRGVEPLLVAAGLILLSAAAVWFVAAHGWTEWYGDAEAHLNIARRILDSQTPGYDQLGSPWLPVPHLLLMPFARIDVWWRSGIAGAIPSAICFVAGGLFLFGAARRVFESRAAAVAAVALASMNPNILYLQSLPMTEPVFYCALMAILYFTVRYRETQGWGSVAGAGIAAFLGTLTRYDGWFLLPFVAGYFYFAAERRKLAAATLFAVIAGLGPLYWLFHNWWLSGDPLEFYRGPYSAKAIQGSVPYPGLHDWKLAFLYYRTAVKFIVGPGLAILGLAGVVAALLRRAFWPIILLSLTGIFYVWSIHSEGLPIHVPGLWPNSWYNTRYGLGVLPLLAFAAAALVAILPGRMRSVAAVLVIAAGSIPWALHPTPEAWITWVESRANSEGRRRWTREAAGYLRPIYVPGSGIISSGGDDFAGIYRAMGIPLRETFSIANGLPWDATIARPDLFLWQEWAVVKKDDPVEKALALAERSGIRYRLELTIIKKDEPIVRIYHRIGGMHGTS